MSYNTDSFILDLKRWVTGEGGSRGVGPGGTGIFRYQHHSKRPFPLLHVLLERTRYTFDILLRLQAEESQGWDNKEVK
ncbi:hypothetical protein SAMN05192552_104614 [Natrinema hispanicum]|uniref:Uncharacterized protein n=1 Tax=Natrinema hispanicum TaxID=392421 RepID=A0A1I0JHP6_9EURY|nr:hypothetical protein SAMN05192552_104614 [Natrinema hispanicum]SEU09042.1 hypothetical protein SAMN04488694_14111 [Natrinema hispanicum]